MDLHGIVSGAIDAVNPRVWMTIQVSAGSVQSPSGDGTRIPVYRRAVRRLGQVQPMSNKDLRQVEGLNLQGNPQSIYFAGRVDGLSRAENKGGDVITSTDGRVWLVVQPLEQWPDWCKVCVLQQNEIVEPEG